MKPKDRRLLVALWTGLIVVLVVPWGSVQDHAHWARVSWLPFIGSPVTVGDLIRNVLLYLPWGYILAGSAAGGILTSRVAAYAVILSMLTEATQVMSHGRFPSATDVTCNLFGAWLGARWAERARGSPRTDTAIWS